MLRLRLRLRLRLWLGLRLSDELCSGHRDLRRLGAGKRLFPTRCPLSYYLSTVFDRSKNLLWRRRASWQGPHAG